MDEQLLAVKRQPNWRLPTSLILTVTLLITNPNLAEAANIIQPNTNGTTPNQTELIAMCESVDLEKHLNSPFISEDGLIRISVQKSGATYFLTISSTNGTARNINVNGNLVTIPQGSTANPTTQNRSIILDY
ncbi:MAG: hypothetical protein WCK98_04620 [bacterium]